LFICLFIFPSLFVCCLFICLFVVYLCLFVVYLYACNMNVCLFLCLFACLFACMLVYLCNDYNVKIGRQWWSQSIYFADDITFAFLIGVAWVRYLTSCRCRPGENILSWPSLLNFSESSLQKIILFSHHRKRLIPHE